MRGAHRDDCPCQNYSDSGHALDSRCDAIRDWSRPERFRRVCPLLKQTAEGWRCGVNAESVRPFWGRALLCGSVLTLCLYLAGTLALYTGLRVARYDTSYLAVVWPPRWGELRDSREKLYAARAQRALKAGHYREAILSLEQVTRLNPQNYAAGLALAGLSQVAAHPYVSDHTYERLMRDVPEQRRQTAQIWFRALLARAAYLQVRDLATRMLSEDPAERPAWLHALLFSTHQTGDHAGLGKVLAEHPHLPDWCTELIGIEQLLLQGHLDRALPRLTRVYHQPAAGFLPYYQIDRLLRHGASDPASNLLRAYGGKMPPDEAAFLRLRLYQAKGWTVLAETELEVLLGYEMAPRIIAQFCAYLINRPDPSLFARFHDRLTAANLPLNFETVPLHQAVYLSAVLAGENGQADQIFARIKQYTNSDARVLRGLGKLLRAPAPDPRLPRILPLVPLPTEVVYAILERTPRTTPPE